MKIDRCSECDCGKERPIVNSHFYLCQQKNKERLSKNRPQKTRVVDYTKKPKRYTIKKVSTKRQPLETQYSKVIKEIAQTRELRCTGCGRYQGGDIRLSNSHIISRKDCENINRLDLIVNPNNITYHCLDFGNHKGCHSKWENPVKRISLLDYKQNIDFIKTVSDDLFLKYSKNE